jgi:anti-anti-sigma factor
MASANRAMRITEDCTSGVCVLGLSNRLDSATAKLVEDKIVGLITAGNHRLVLDLAELEYVSSAGLRVFLLAAKRLKAANGALALSGLTDNVRQTFDIAGFSSIFSIHASRAAAIEHVGRS